MTGQQPIQYPVPWDTVFSLTPHLLHGTRHSVDAFSAAIVARLQPPPVFLDMDCLPPSPRFVVAANHYQRKGLWILHSASAITQLIRQRYGPGDPPVRWIVTANWPPIRLGPWRFPSPGDRLLSRVAHALHCYPVAFSGNNPAFTAQSLRRILKEARHAERPIGIFPEGVAGVAGTLHPPLPGVDRLLAHLAKAGLPVVPFGISERDGFVIRCGEPIPCDELVQADDAAALTMRRITDLL